MKIAHILKLSSTPWSLYSFLPQGLYLWGSYGFFFKSIGILLICGTRVDPNVPAIIGATTTNGEITDYPETKAF